MAGELEEKNKALVLKAFDTLSTNASMQQRSDSGPLTTSNTALISHLVVKVCSI